MGIGKRGGEKGFSMRIQLEVNPYENNNSKGRAHTNVTCINGELLCDDNITNSTQ